MASLDATQYRQLNLLRVGLRQAIRGDRFPRLPRTAAVEHLLDVAGGRIEGSGLAARRRSAKYASCRIVVSELLIRFYDNLSTKH